MTAYLIGRLRVRNWSWYKEYRSITEPLVEEYGGMYLVKGGNGESLEGSEPPGDATVLIVFPDRAAIHAWYNDPRYAPMKALREKYGVLCDLKIVDGLYD
ncbi:MAG: DUF1330 domain-containing protein [Steroidobacteraceae bacterium]